MLRGEGSTFQVLYYGVSYGSVWYPYFMRDIRKTGGGDVDVVTERDELRDRMKMISAAKKRVCPRYETGLHK
jgi:hypothetical protein